MPMLKTGLIILATWRTAAASTAYQDSVLHETCRTMQQEGVATICNMDVESLRPLAPIVYTFDKEDEVDKLHLYPNMYYARPLREHEDPPVAGCNNNDALVIQKATKHEKVPFPVSDLDNLIEKDHVQYQDLVTTLRQEFDNCVSSSLSRNASPTELQEWANGVHARRCKGIAEGIFRQYSAMVEQASSSRKDRNALLKRIATDWGSNPSALAVLLLLFGCYPDESYDEFMSCNLDVGDILLDVNIHQRNHDPDQPNEWSCDTCAMHQHPIWFASHVVAGTVTYTMAVPDCTSEQQQERVPSVEELDRNLKGPTMVDVVGTRYHIGRTDVVWETTEVVDIRQGSTLLFPPNWYHRLVPPKTSATHTPVTLVAKYDREVDIYGSEKSMQERKLQGDSPPFDLKPHEVDVDITTKFICYKFIDLIYALWRPDLQVKEGLKLIPCESNGMLYDPEGDWGNPSNWSKQPGESEL